jgi:two-component system cell cycle sensor histidine kinase/response regulator CckA
MQQDNAMEGTTMKNEAGRDAVPRHLIFVFLLFVIGISGAGYLYYEAQKRDIKKDREADLSAIADLKVHQIADWRRERIADAEVIFENPMVARGLQPFIEGPPPTAESKKATITWMQSLRTRYTYKQIYLLDRNGNVRFSLDFEKPHVIKQTLALAGQAMRAKKVIMSDLQRDEKTHEIYLELFVPLLISQGRDTFCFGLLLARIDPYRILYPLIQTWPSASRTSETFLVRREGDDVLFLNELRHAKSPALSFRLPLSQQGLPAALALQGKEGIVEGPDYRGVPVLAALRGVPDSPWFLVAKVDLDEVYGPLHGRGFLVIMLVLILIALTGGIVFVLLREQRLRYYQNQYQVELERRALIEHYEHLTKHANDIILLIDETGKIVEVNDRAIAAYGYTREELIGRDLRTLRSPSVEPSVETWMRQVQERNGMVYESLHVRKDGSEIPVEVSSRLFEVDGKKFYQSFVRDITERKQQEREIRTLAQAVRSTSECVIISDLEDNILFVNDAFARTYGYGRKELLGKNVLIIRSENNPPDLVEQIRPATLRGGWQGELLNRKKDGTEFPIFLSTSVVHDENGKPFALVGVAQDITERKRAEEALRDSEWKLKEAQRLGRIGHWEFDVQTGRIRWSDMVFEIYERDPKLGPPTEEEEAEYYSPEDAERLRSCAQQTIETGLPYQIDVRLKLPDGRIKDVVATGAPVRDSLGRVTRLLGTVQDITERKRAEQALRESEERYRRLVETAPDVIYSLSEDGTITTLNPAFEKITGWSRDECLGKPFMPFVHPDDLPRAVETFQRVLRGETPASYELRILSKSGEYLVGEFISTPQMRDGKVIGELGIARDVTQRKRAEEALRESEKKYRDLINGMNDTVWVIDFDTTILDVNNAAARVLGYTREELLSMKIPDIDRTLAPEQVQNLARNMPKDKIQIFETCHTTKDGRKLPVEVSSSLVSYGGKTAILSIARDITDRKRAEAELRKEKAFMDALMDNIPDSIYFKDRECRMVRINRKMMQSLKLDEVSQAIGKTDVELFGEEFGRTTLASDQHLLASGEPIIGQVESRQLEDGQINWTSTTKVPLRDETGQIVGLVGITREINELMRVQEEREHERNLLRTLIDNLPDYIYVKDTEGRFVLGNTATVHKFGFASERELIGKSDFDLFPPELAAQYYADEQEIIQSGEGIYNYEGSALDVTKEEKERWLSTTKVPLRDAQGKIIGIVGIGRDLTERKRAEEALRALSIRNEAILASVPDIIMEVDDKKVYRWANCAGIEFFGEDVIGKEASFYFEGEQNTYDRVEPLFAGDEEVVHIESWQRRRDGQKRLLAWWCKVLKDPEGKPVGALSTARDITEQRRAEEILAQERNLLRILIDNLPDQVFVKDRESRFLVCNSGVARRAGARRPEELLEKTDFDIFPREVAAVYFADEQRIMRSGEPIVEKEDVFVDETGTKTWFTTTKIPVRDNQGNIIGLVGVNRDMTERKRTEERLRLSDQILQRVNALVLVADAEGEITYVSPSVKKILGYDEAEILGNGWWNISRDDEEERKREKAFVARCARGESTPSATPYERMIKSRDGVPHYILWQETKGPGDLVIGVGHDITERKLLEDQLRQAQKLESLGTLAGGIAHDFNNVLGIILGYTSMIRDKKDDPKKLSRSIEAIDKAVQRGAGLVRQLLTFARKTETLLESVRLNDVIVELTSMLRETFPRTIQVSSQLGKDIPSITGDANQLHQALLNLSVNARDAMPKGGTLTFTTRTFVGTELRRRFSAAQMDQYVCVSVADTGIGMDKSLLARVFEPFFTTKAKGHGTGLGLAVVYGIVASHHGFIDVESQVGHGTTFHLYFPIPERNIEAPPIETEQAQENVPGGTETLLVVEDEEMMLDLLKHILAAKGYRVMTAKDGEEAVEVYSEHRNHIDMVLMDMGLPKLSGAEALKRLKEINPKVKVIFASGYIDPHIKSEVLKAGVKHFVQKPYIPQEVLQHIRKVIDSDRRL